MKAKDLKLPSTYRKRGEITIPVFPFDREGRRPVDSVTIAIFTPTTPGQVVGVFRQVNDEKPTEIGDSYEDFAGAIRTELMSEARRKGIAKRTPRKTVGA